MFGSRYGSIMSVTSEGTSSSKLLLWREVLATPVVIGVGETKTIVSTITFPAPTA